MFSAGADPRRGPLRRLFVALAALLLTLAPLTPASAHAELTSSSPADGAAVPQLPSTVELRFSEAIASPAYVTVTDPAGREVSVGPPEVLDTLVAQPVADSAAAGAYTVEYRVVSSDGHSISGSLDFTVALGTGAPDADTGPATSAGGFWAEHWRQAALAGVGLLAGVALLGTGLRERR